MLSMRMARPKVLIDIMHLPELAKIEADANAIRIGAGAYGSETSGMACTSRTPTAPGRRAATGSDTPKPAAAGQSALVAHADPSAEIPLVLLALKGAIHLSSRQKQRRVPAVDFFTGIMSTARNDDELIEGIEAPCRTPGHGYAFREFGRRHGDFAIVACAAVAHADGMRLAIGGVADCPAVRDYPDLTGTALDDALDGFAWELDARDDLHATGSFRRNLVRQLGRAVIEEARRCRA
jgi:2-furoyl-CoA dehydrogenase FAD binding subunit